ncbi:T9SS type A sorting domain-containing protein [Flavobacteriales bacterium]|nr:T9SS type A sorting domain-containing protein [Flavobacteriales bacterium]
MKKILLTLTLAFYFVGVNAQCMPDPQYTIDSVGVYPDTIVGLADAFVGQMYSQNITIITPTDTVVDVFGTMVPVTIDNIDLTSVTGLPPNFSYTCDPPNCSFPGGSIHCAELYSTISPTAADVGIYPIILNTTAYASDVPFLGTMTQDDVTEGYYIEILDNTTATFNHFNQTTFELKQVYPNPVYNNVSIQFISGISKEIVLNIYNLLGEEVESHIIFSRIGANTIDINTSSYSEGIFLYTINNGSQILTKRMVVKN